MNIYLKNILSILEEQKYYFEPFELKKPSINEVKTWGILEDLQETLEDLDGISLPLEVETNLFSFSNDILVFDDESVFNKYRIITLRNEGYRHTQPFSIEHYRRFSRQFEPDCIKSASQSQKWTTKEAENYFGNSNTSGDLSMSGSAQWKLNAFRALMTDFTCYHRKHRLVRIPLYDTLMINKQLISLKQILLSPKKEEREIIFNYLKRKFNYEK